MIRVADFQPARITQPARAPTLQCSRIFLCTAALVGQSRTFCRWIPGVAAAQWDKHDKGSATVTGRFLFSLRSQEKGGSDWQSGILTKAAVLESGNDADVADADLV